MAARSTSPSHAVMKISGTAAASRMPRLAGFGASRSASTAAYSASDPCRPPTPPVIPKTSSSFRKLVTPEPTASTTPARSMPRIAGNGWRAWAAWPARILTSSGLTALALTLTRTCPGLGCGRGIGATRNIWLVWKMTTARRSAQQSDEIVNGSKLKRRVIDDLFHHKERSGLPNTGQRDQLVAVNPFEIRDVFGPDFQEIIEIACDQVTIEDEFQFRDGLFERRETLRCRAIEHDADHHQRAPVDLLRRDHRANAADVTLLEQRLGPAVTGRGTDVDQLRQFGIGEPPIALKQAQHFQADPVNFAAHGRIFRIFVKYPKITTCFIQKIFEVVNLPDVLESTFLTDNVNFQAIEAADRRASRMLEKFERYPLTFGPTHIEKLERLGAHLGGKVELYAKREDCNSGLAFGGNKLRKLEYIIPDAIASNADTLVSIGGVQSNHTRMVAAVAAKIGMKCRLVQESWVPHEDAVYDRVGNILLSRIMGAELEMVDEGFDIGIRQSWEAAIADVKAKGGKPYAIPAGASVHKYGGLGYVGFAEEVRAQEKELGFAFDYIIVCTVTGSTP